MYNNILNSLSDKLSPLSRRLHSFVLLALTSTLASILASTLTSCGNTETGADPGIENFPIAYVNRAILTDDEGMIIQPDTRRPLRSSPGGDIYLKNRASVSSPSENITRSLTNGRGDVRDLEVSSDGKLLVFSLLTEDPDPDDDADNPKWDIYIYNRETKQIRRVIQSNVTAREGDDIAPYFLPNNNRIVFSSNRQTKSRSILLDENRNKPQFSSQDEDNRTKALVLHVMDIDGSNIKQISFNQSHDLDPVVLKNGRILFSRWDNMNRNDAINLYTILQDGSDLQPYYGTHDQSHEIPNVEDSEVHFTQPREMNDGRIMVLQKPFSGTFAGGEVITIDGNNYVDINQGINANAGIPGGSAIEKVTRSNLKFDDSITTVSRYSSFYPINDGTDRILISKGICRIQIDTRNNPENPLFELRPCIEPYISDPTVVETFPSYGIWLYDSGDQTEKPVELPADDRYLSEAVVMRPYDRATINLGKDKALLDEELVTENVGVLTIRSIYDFGNGSFDGCFFVLCMDSSIVTDLSSLNDGAISADMRHARFLRIVKAVGLPNRRDPDLNNPPDLSSRAFGRGGRRLGMKEIIGYTPIQPDGSVRVKVPADVAFYLEVVDKDARRIGPRHENWLQVKAGETLECTGCHSHPNDGSLPLPHGRKNAEAAPLNTGAAQDGAIYPNTLNSITNSDYLVNFGDTMADVLSRAQGGDPSLSVNVNFEDVWTNPASRMPDASFSYTYSGNPTAEISALSTPSPNTAACETKWDARCRSIINYQEHIQPIWEVMRGPAENSYSCISCHATTDALGLAKVPDGQLDLTPTDPSDEDNQQIESYRELFFNDNFQELSGNVLVDATITRLAFDNGEPVLDQDGVQLTEQVPDPDRVQPPTMSTNGARESYFMEKMTESEIGSPRDLTPSSAANYVNHKDMLNAAELRLIAEYLDIGGQYFNHPFDPKAPQN